MKSKALKNVIPLICATALLLTSTAGTIAAKDASADELMRQGFQAYQRGAFDKALTSWKQAAQLYEQDGKIRDQSRALVNAAQASEATGQVTQALQQLEVALAIAQKLQDRLWTITVLDNLGRTYLAARQPDAATQYLTQALEMTTAQDSPRTVAAIQNNLGLAQVAQKKMPEALTSFTTAAEAAAASGDRPLAARARVNAARAELALKHPEASRNWLDQALDGLKDMDDSHDKAMGLIQVGLGYQQLRPAMPSYDSPLVLRAAGLFVEANTVAEKIGDTRTRS